MLVKLVKSVGFLHTNCLDAEKQDNSTPLMTGASLLRNRGGAGRGLLESIKLACMCISGCDLGKR